MKLRELLDTLAQLDSEAEVYVATDVPIGHVEVRQQAGADRHGISFPPRVYLVPEHHE
jgi:hypothetical protein